MEGRGWREQDWPIALAGISRPCSREVGPVVRLPAGSGGATHLRVQVLREEENSILSNPPPQ